MKRFASETFDSEAELAVFFNETCDLQDTAKLVHFEVKLFLL